MTSGHLKALTKALAAALCGIFIASPLLAVQDKIILKQGAPVVGEIKGVDAAGNVTIAFDKGTLPYPKANIAGVELEERPEFTQGVESVQNGDYEKAIGLLKPLVDKFLGLEVGWVAQAAAYYAEALAETGKTFDSEQVSDKIMAAYPTEIFRYQGMVSKARTLLVRDKPDEAMALLAEVEKAVPPMASPDPFTMQILGNMHFVKGLIFRKKGDAANALSEFLVVNAIYYRPARRAQAALQQADDIRKESPKIYVQ